MADTTMFTNKRSTIQSNDIDDLTDSLLVEILIRLPCKVVNQCKTVSKHWLALISSPYFHSRFVYHHHNHFSPSSLPFALVHQFWSKTFIAYEDPVFKSRGFSLSFLPSPCFQPNWKVSTWNWIIGSFKDLLLCYFSSWYPRFYYICNPFTMQWVELPPTPKCQKAVRFGFICDPYCGDEDKERLCTKINTQCRYRVVLFPKLDKPSSLFTVHIFSSETGRWSESIVSCSRVFSLSDNLRSAIACNGMLHWWSRENCIIVFDPYNNNNTDDDTRSCRFIDCPMDLKPASKLGIDCFGVCQGRLGICQVLNYVRRRRLCVWELKDYNTGEWRLVHKVYFKDLVSKISWKRRCTSDKWYIRTVALHPNDRDIVYLWFAEFDHPVLCNMSRKTLEVAPEISEKQEFSICCHDFSLILQSWPTPVPKLSPNALEQ